MTLTGDHSLLREINRMSLVRAVLRESGLSRADLAKATGLNKSTVSLLAQDLIDEGWLQETGLQVTGSVGRRPTPLSLNDERLAMIGVDLSVEHLNALVVSLSGRLVDGLSEPLVKSDPEQAIFQLAKMTAKLILKSQQGGRQLLGLGVGVPGAVAGRHGLIRLAPNLVWRNLPFQDLLTQGLASLGVKDLPIVVQNNYDAAALGEYQFGDHPAPDPLIYLGLGVGVGAGIVMGGQLFLGADGLAGEVGHSILQLDGPVCSCGRKGCAETFIGQRAISTQISGNAKDLLSIATIKRLLERGDEAALLAVRRAGNHLGVLIQNLWTCFNPGRIVVGGPLCALGSPLLDGAQSCLDGYSAQCDMVPPEICAPRCGASSIAVGAAAMVLHRRTRPHDTHWHSA